MTSASISVADWPSVCRTIVSMFWTAVLSLFLRVLSGSFTSRGWVWRGAIWAVRV